MPDPSPIELEVRRLRRLIEVQRFAEARTAAQALLATVPENRDVLYACAHAQRMLGDIPAALETLSRLERAHPRFSRTHQERGFCHVALRQAPEAIEAFQRAVAISPALPVSWSMLRKPVPDDRPGAEAAQAAAQATRLHELPPEVVTAAALFADGELARAEESRARSCASHGHHVEAMRLLARIAMERDVQTMRRCCSQASSSARPITTPPASIMRRCCPSASCTARRSSRSRSCSRWSRTNRSYLTLYALTQVGLGEHERADRGLPRAAPGGAAARGAAPVDRSPAQDAGATPRWPSASIGPRRRPAPDIGDAYWSLANLKTYRFTDEELRADGRGGIGRVRHRR